MKTKSKNNGASYQDVLAHIQDFRRLALAAGLIDKGGHFVLQHRNGDERIDFPDYGTRPDEYLCAELARRLRDLYGAIMFVQ